MKVYVVLMTDYALMADYFGEIETFHKVFGELKKANEYVNKQPNSQNYKIIESEVE